MREVAIVLKIMKGIHPVRPEESVPPQNEQANRFWSLLTKCWAQDPWARPTATHVREEVGMDMTRRTFYLTGLQVGCIASGVPLGGDTPIRQL